jgi:hypothetical protein
MLFLLVLRPSLGRCDVEHCSLETIMQKAWGPGLTRITDEPLVGLSLDDHAQNSPCVGFTKTPI